jgi:hypothetical protein
MKPPSVDEARLRIREALASQPLAIAPEALNLMIEEAAVRMASGQSHEQSPAIRYVPIRSKSGARPARRKTATAAKSASSKPPWLLEDEPGAPRRELDVHFSEHRDSGVTVTIGKRAAEAIAHFAGARGLHTEEGGVLVGPRWSLGAIEISEAAGPGPNSQRTANSYLMDHAHDLAFVADRRKWLANPDLRELGVWHLHPSSGDATTPSAGDLQHSASMLQMLGGSYGRWLSSYVGVILAPRRNGFTASAWVTEEGGRIRGVPWFTCRPAELVVEGQSWSA